ncbi:MAG: cytochrome-c oxidase [Verrucomicrobia bacterium]|nr:MAG: cytochrome-c oxidase [Verrucomicrobiota bacterium]
MNRLRSLFLIIILLFFSSWLGVVVYSYLELGHFKSVAGSDGILPPYYSGQAILGARVYAASGCMTCHTQQIRQLDVTHSDIDRKWGTRPSVALDYLRDQTAFLGKRRMGPDLSNVGSRLTDPIWYYHHLYEPDQVTPGSIMPSYRYLFHMQKIQGELSAQAIPLTGPHAPPPGYEVVPTKDAQDLVAYLLSLKHDYTLPEVSAETPSAP